MGYLIFRGVSTASLTGVEVAKMPSHKKASMMQTEYHIKGRDGNLHVNEGFANFNLQATLVLINASASARQIVNAWADGSGKLITSDDLTKAYKATVASEIQWNRVKANAGYYDTATITWNCDPFVYEAVDSVVTLTETGSIVNATSADAYPLIQVNGSGDVSFTFAGEDITISSMSASDPVFIDCETGYIYSQSGATQEMTGNIPYLPIGTNAVTFGENLTSLTVTPHWRWI